MKRPHRRQFLHLAASAAALIVVSQIASAQTYPARPITLVVPFAPGGANDVIGRVLAPRMRASLGQPIIIETVAERAAASAPAGLLAQHLMDTPS